LIAGLALVFIGCVMQAAKEFICSNSESSRDLIGYSPAGAWLVWLITMVSVGYGLRSVYCAVSCISPNAPNQSITPLVTILFPFYSPDNASIAKKLYARLKSVDDGAEGRISEQDVAAEYEAQLSNMGAILFIKLIWNKKAVKALLTQLFLLAAAAFLTFLGFMLKNAPIFFGSC
jgi:hypothetical protein